MGMYKMPSHTTINGTVSFTTMDQNDTLIPWTINCVINQPLGLGRVPGLAALPRRPRKPRSSGVNALVNFNTRPNRYFGVRDEVPLQQPRRT